MNTSIYRLILIKLSLILGIISSFAIQPLRVGSERMELLLPLLSGKRVALMVNQTSLVGQTHLLDTLVAQGVSVIKIFVPEHGFRGDVDAGKYVRNGRDVKTGVPIISLYGRSKRPSALMLADVDVLLFDVQDVGVRFYTYISSMHYLMEAAADHSKQMIVCDRPNPNDYIDGPILEDDCRSFVGMHPIPIMHGLTVGELAQMINGEGWLGANKKCDLTIVPIEGWRHGQPYTLFVRPSPNLPNARSIALYPSLCLFEASIMSVGRGTHLPFQSLAYPNRAFGKKLYTPHPKRGEDSKPKHEGKTCYGIDLTNTDDPIDRITLTRLVEYQAIAKAQSLELIDRKRMFELLMGNKRILPMLRAGKSEQEIRATWLDSLEAYRQMRSRYLLYPDTF